MSAIADFKKRRQAQREQQAQQGEAVHNKLLTEPENKALALLAALLGCEPDQAITIAEKLVENGAYLRALTEQQAEAINEQMADDIANHANEISNAAENVDAAADTVNAAAENVTDATSNLEDTANQLAYSADDIGNATAELKEATAELKKPSAVHQSSRGAKAEKQKSNSKKSG